MSLNNDPVLRTTAKTFEIIDSLSSIGPAGVTTIAETVELPKSTVHHHLRTMEQYNLVVSEDGEYRLGLQFLDYGEKIKSGIKLYEIGRIEVKNLAEQTGELSHLLVPEHGKGIILYRARGERGIHIDTHPGKQLYMHQPATGKAVLANLPEERVDEIIDEYGLPARTPNTITSRRHLKQELAEISNRGYAIDVAEWNEQLWCAAAPIKKKEEAIGAISVSSPLERVREENLEDKLVDSVLSAANVIEIKGSYH